jgi:hypothetical protein
MPAPPSCKMNLKEKYLYHQIHPLKLFTDIGAAFGSLYLLWRLWRGRPLLHGLIAGTVDVHLVVNFSNPAKRDIVVLTLLIFLELDGISTFHMVDGGELAIFRTNHGSIRFHLIRTYHEGSFRYCFCQGSLWHFVPDRFRCQSLIFALFDGSAAMARGSPAQLQAARPLYLSTEL